MASRPITVSERVQNFLGWAFVISLALHFLVLPLVVKYNPGHAEQPEAEKVSVSKKVKVVVPTPPPPTPTPPPPTPPPKSTPPPVHQTNPPPVPRLKVNVPKTTSNSSSTTTNESKYNVKQGSESGVPQGNVASAKPAPPPPTTKPATPAPPPPTPSPTPRPQCAVPNKEATLVSPYTPDTPEIAKEQGVSGTVAVEVSLDATGHVTGASVLTTPSSTLNQAAIQAAHQSTYAPKLQDCKPVAGDYKLLVEFSAQ